jgi:hypothetical protein
MLILYRSLVAASMSAAVDRLSAEANPPTFGEPPTLQLAIAAIVTLLIYSLASRTRRRLRPARFPDIAHEAAEPAAATTTTTQEAA